MLRCLPPSGLPISPIDILAGVRAMFSGEQAVNRFNQKVCQYFGVRYALTVSSGRAGLSLLLQSLYKLNPGRDEVLIPAFTSFSVPAAVINAGLKVSLYDLAPATISPDCESLASAISDKTLCIIVCHLFGYPADLDAVIDIATERNIPIIDDAAQAMGAYYKGKPAGTFGTAGLFSLSRGKNITAVDGGIVVTNDEALAMELATIPLLSVGIKDSLILMLKAVVLSFILHPRFYWIPRCIPSLEIGVSQFAPHFILQRFTAFQAGIALRMLGRLDRINSGRKVVAEKITNLFSGNMAVQYIQAVPGGEPVFLRFPIIGSLAEENLELGLVRSYPLPIHQVPGIEQYLSKSCEYPGAKLLAEHVLTLPTHCYVTNSDCVKAVKSFSEAI